MAFTVGMAAKECWANTCSLDSVPGIPSYKVGQVEKQRGKCGKGILSKGEGEYGKGHRDTAWKCYKSSGVAGIYQHVGDLTAS